ncbi:hypothetical protein D3C75_1063770 [compost metagenome]
MPVYRANVVKAQLFKQRAGDYHAFEVFFGTLEQFFDRRYAGEHLLAAFAQRGVELARQQLRQMIIQRPDVFGDRHFVVVQHYQHIRGDITRMIHGFERHACGDGTVANYADGAAVFALTRGGHGHAKTCADRG